MTQAPTITAQSIAQAPIPQADLDRKRLMADAWHAYRGEFQKPLKVDRDQPDDNVLCNFCGPIVDKGASWLFGKPVKITATEVSGDQKTIQKWLDGFWGDDDDKMALLSDASQNGGVCGQAFVKIIPPRGMMKYPRLVVLDPEIVRMVTAPDDCSLVLAYIIEYNYSTDYNPGQGAIQKRQIIARIDPDGLAEIAGEYDLDDTWTISNYMRRTSATGAQTDWQQVGTPEVWPYPFPPIFTNKNLPNPNESWGTPDLTSDIIDQNKTLIFLLSNLARIIKYHGHPKTYAIGIGKGQLDTSVDGVIVLPAPDSKLGTLLPMENFTGILSVLATIMSNIDQQSRVPAVALGRQENLPNRMGPLSGVAIALMFQPLIEKTELKQRLYGKMIREVSRAALVIGGLLNVEDMEDCKIGLHWEPLIPADDLMAAQEALILQQIGVSEETIFSGLGLDAADEANKKVSEDQKKAVAFSRGQGMPPAPPTMPGQAPMQQPAQAGGQ
jgi:hypothetical protein